MTQEHWMIAAAIWLLLGLLADKICEKEARKKNEPYAKTIVAACYIAGPLIIPLALCWAFMKGLRNLLR